MPHRKHGDKKQQAQEIAALAAITNAILKEVKDNKNLRPTPRVMQIIIYESSV